MSTSKGLPQVTEATALTGDAFEVYGKVIAPPTHNGSKMRISKPANQGTAEKMIELAQIKNGYPAKEDVQTNVHIFVSNPTTQRTSALPFDVKVLERHLYTTQMFVPMASHEGATLGEDEGYFVLVALNGKGTRYRSHRRQPRLVDPTWILGETDAGD